MKKLNKSHFLLLGLFIAILPYLYLCFFANPSADDFSLSGQAQQNDFLHLMYHNYFFWNGRYISNIFIYLNPIIFGKFLVYKIIPFVIIILIMIANFSFISQLFYKKPKELQLTLSFVLGLLFLHNMPIIAEGIYWFTGAVIYLLGIIVSQFYLAFLIKTIRENRKGFSSVFLAILLFLACGFNEVLTLLIVFFLAITSFLFYQKDFVSKKIIYLQFLLSILFAAVMIFSPGNEVRGEAYQNTHYFSYSFLYSALQVGRFSFLWIVSIPLVATSLLYFQFNKNTQKENQLLKNSFYINRWVSLLILFAITFICVFPAYWATGILGQHRTLNVAYFFFLTMWFINLTVWYNYYEKKLMFLLAKRIKITLVSFLLIGLMATGNGHISFYDIFSGSANNYDKQMKNRFIRLKKQNNRSNKTIVFPKISNPPKSLSASDISSNPEDWTNKAYNLYFRLDSTEISVK